MEKELLINNEATPYSLKTNSEGKIVLTLEGESFTARLVDQNGHGATIELNGKFYHLWRGGKFTGLSEQTVTVESARDKRKKKGASGGSDEMSSPMPGKILKVLVNEGDNVEAGQGLVVMEAMKMEHTIKAAYPGTIKKVFYGEGDLVDGGVDLVELEGIEEGN